MVERLRVCFWTERSEVQTSGRSIRSLCCQLLATAAIFLWKEPCCPGAMTRKNGPSNSLHASNYYSKCNERFDTGKVYAYNNRSGKYILRIELNSIDDQVPAVVLQLQQLQQGFTTTTNNYNKFTTYYSKCNERFDTGKVYTYNNRSGKYILRIELN